MKINKAILSVICLFAGIFFMGCGNGGSNNSSSQNLSSGGTLVGKTFSGGETREGSTKFYIEIEFINESVCTRFWNEYDVESDKFYDYPDAKKRYNYKRIGNELILTKEGADGSDLSDVKKITISENNLIFPYGGQTFRLTSTN